MLKSPTIFYDYFSGLVRDAAFQQLVEQQKCERKHWSAETTRWKRTNPPYVTPKEPLPARAATVEVAEPTVPMRVEAAPAAPVSSTPAGLPSEPLCLQPLGAIGLVLRILPQAMADRMPFHDDVFGFAAISTDEGPSILAGVFYHRVQALSDALGHSRAATLGYVMAHEIGHLLLRTSGHSAFGIMRGRFTPNDLLRPLGFTPTQSLIIRTDVAGRNRRQQADALADIAVRN